MTTVRIELDREDAVYHPGEMVRGRLVVDADGATPCKGLGIEIKWRSQGQSISKDEGAVDAHVELEEVRHIPAGESSYPFAVRAPGGPFSYTGKSFVFSWRIYARLDIPWAIDPKTSVGFSLVPATEVSHGPQTQGYRVAARADAAVIDLGSEAVSTAAKEKVPAHYWGGALALVLGNLVTSVFNPFLLAALLCTLPAGIHLFYRAIQIHKGKRAVGNDIYAGASPRELSPGQALSANVLFTPPKDFVVEEISAHLIAEEILVRGSGSNTRTYRERVFDSKLPLAAPATRYPAAKPVDLSKAFELPHSAPLSIGIRRNEVRWELRFKVDGEGVPHWSSVQVIVVRPPG